MKNRIAKAATVAALLFSFASPALAAQPTKEEKALDYLQQTAAIRASMGIPAPQLILFYYRWEKQGYWVHLYLDNESGEWREYHAIPPHLQGH